MDDIGTFAVYLSDETRHELAVRLMEAVCAVVYEKNTAKAKQYGEPIPPNERDTMTTDEVGEAIALSRRIVDRIFPVSE